MARREKSTSKEVLNISSDLSKMAKGSEKLISSFEKAALAGEKLPRALSRSFKKAQAEMMKDTRRRQKELEKLIKTTGSQNAELKKQIKLEEQAIRQNKDKLDTMERINERYDRQKGLISGLSSRITNLVSVTGALNLVWTIATKIFTTWVDLQEKWARSMGSLAQKTGATTAQFAQMRGTIEGLRSTFGNLEGDVDGIANSSQFVGELTTSFRQLSLVTEDFGRTVLETSRGFGIGTEATSLLFRTIRNGATGADSNLTDFGGNMLRFANEIGASAANLVQDFVDARASVAQFGRSGQETFRKASMMANHFGLETKKIFDMMKGFDTFESASNNVNQLNAMMGTSISSFDMMMEQDPTRRLEMLRGSIMGVGMSWDRMNRMQRMSVAQTLGVEEDVAARLFQENITFQDLERERSAAAIRQKKDADRQRSNTEMMNNLLLRTTAVFETLDRQFQRFWNLLAEYFSPVIQEIQTRVVGLARRFTEWLRSTTGQKQMKQFMTDARNLIRDAFNWVERHIPTWEQFKKKVQEFWQEAKKIGEVLMPALQWMWDHKELIAIIFAASKLTPFISGLTSIAGMLGPSGIVGSAAAGLGPVLAGAAAPLGAILGSYALAQAAEGRELSQNALERSGDSSTRRDLGEAALREARNRRMQFESLGGRELALRGSQNTSGFAATANMARINTQQGLGLISGGEANIQRSGINHIVRAIARNRDLGPAGAARAVRESMGPRLTAEIERQQGKPIEQIIAEYRANDPAFRSPQAGSATETAPATSSTVQAPANLATNNPREDIVIHNVMTLDDGTIAHRSVQRAVSGR